LKDPVTAEDRLRYEIGKCRNCEACRSLVDSSCLVFPEIFRPVDQERETGKKITTDELIHLINLCTFCAACPCLDIRAAIIEAKTDYMDRHGVKFKIRAIDDVARIGRLGSVMPELTNILLQNAIARALMEKGAGIHRARKMPLFSGENFKKWLRTRNKRMGAGTREKKVAYFAGCMATYFFPEVAKAVVEVFERNGIDIHYPEQGCCGMPALLEGDREKALELVGINVERLAKIVEEGYDIVCSCPTCGYMLKNILKAGAQYAPECREPVEAGNGIVRIPIHGLMSSEYNQFFPMHAQLYEALLKDTGYFSSINPTARINVAQNTFDVGEYLRNLHNNGQLDDRLGPVSAETTYYPPCHLREQRIGRPYEDLLGLIPDLSLNAVIGNFCCGNGGIMGFKMEFHHSSIKIASRLITRIKGLNPKVLATDCLSCRLQFNQLTSYHVLHPIEIINQSYANYDGGLSFSKINPRKTEEVK